MDITLEDGQLLSSERVQCSERQAQTRQRETNFALYRKVQPNKHVQCLSIINYRGMVMKLVKVLFCMFLLAFFGLDRAQNTIVVYSVLRN